MRTLAFIINKKYVWVGRAVSMLRYPITGFKLEISAGREALAGLLLSTQS